jgi:biuret amidohydrolase
MRQVHDKSVCESLEEVLEPDRCVLLVVDMQNDAVSTDGKFALAGNAVDDIRSIVPRCARLISRARELGVFIVHVKVITLRDGKSDSPSWIRAKGLAVNETEFFLEGTWGAEIIAECCPMEGEPVVTKHRSSAFVGTNLDVLLRANQVETVVVIGEQTPGCVEATYRDAAYHDYYNVLVEDCVAAFDRAQHAASIMIQKARHDVCSSDDLIAIWTYARQRERPMLGSRPQRGDQSN